MQFSFPCVGLQALDRLGHVDEVLNDPEYVIAP